MSNWKNVNNWHWTNKNCMNWAKDYLKERLVDLEIEHEGYKIKTTEIIECSGDADLNQRKGKFISIIDLEVELKWEGDKPDGEKITGKIKIPELQSSGDVEFEIEVHDDPSDKDAIRKIIREQLGPLMNEKVKNFGNDMLETHSKDVYIEPSKLGTSTTPPRPITPNESIIPTTTPTTTTTKESIKESTKESTQESTKGSLSKTSLGNVTTIKETVELQTSADQVYETLLDPGRVAAWTRSRPDIFRQIGTSFSLFDGNITGTILELVPNEKIVQKWRLKAWPEGHYSTVTLKFEQTTDFTRVYVTQEGIPIGEEEIVRRNWQSYYWNSIKSVFGYGFISSTINNNNDINKSFIKNNNYKNKSKDNNNNNKIKRNNVNRNNSSSSSSNSNNNNTTDSINDNKKDSKKKISKKNKNNNNNRRKSKNSNSSNEGGINYVFVVASVLTVIVLGFAFLSRSSTPPTSNTSTTSIPSSSPSSA
ncbi:hypothetical protein Glove_122g13 [Diversispora epigaea]|uniref:Activator of Hsp90 ATPase AHSA1-like N-terminal domain-containing protein n=1 Tax=Diversispora epigaea TaxID=1348612 RepID=A0A397IZ37_9GLOM|nr:hypothetical protein Glove_122g13 [Diversispora epigaea]